MQPRRAEMRDTRCAAAPRQAKMMPPATQPPRHVCASVPPTAVRQVVTLAAQQHENRRRRKREVAMLLHDMRAILPPEAQQPPRRSFAAGAIRATQTQTPRRVCVRACRQGRPQRCGVRRWRKQVVYVGENRMAHAIRRASAPSSRHRRTSRFYATSARRRRRPATAFTSNDVAVAEMSHRQHSARNASHHAFEPRRRRATPPRAPRADLCRGAAAGFVAAVRADTVAARCCCAATCCGMILRRALAFTAPAARMPRSPADPSGTFTATYGVGSPRCRYDAMPPQQSAAMPICHMSPRCRRASCRRAPFCADPRRCFMCCSRTPADVLPSPTR